MERVRTEAWIQMGVERRETWFEVASQHTETMAHCWYQSQLLWGWAGLGFFGVPPEAYESWRSRQDEVGQALQAAIRNTRLVRLPDSAARSGVDSSTKEDICLNPEAVLEDERARNPEIFARNGIASQPLYIWVQLGAERRETVVEIPEDEYKARSTSQLVQENGIVGSIDEIVVDWLYGQFGRGWSTSDGDGANDGFMVAVDHGFLAITVEQSIPNTRCTRLPEIPFRSG